MIPQSLPSMPGGPFGGFGQSSAEPQYTDKQARYKEMSDLQTAKRYNLAELALMKQFGAPEDEIAAEKAANAARIAELQAIQKGDGYQSIDYAPINNTYTGKAYTNQLTQALDKTQSFFDDYDLSPYLMVPGKRGSYTLMGYDPYQAAQLIANTPGSVPFDETNRWARGMNFARDTHGKDFTADQLAAYGKMSAVKDNPNLWKVALPGGVSGYFSADGEGDTSYTGDYYDTYYYKKPKPKKKKGGLGGLGGLIGAAAGIALGPAGWGVIGSQIGASALGGAIGGALSGGGIEGALRGGLMGGISGGIGEGLAALPGGANFVGPLQPSDFIGNTGVTWAQGLGSVGKGALMAGLGGGSGPDVLLGGLSGGLGQIASSYMPSGMGWLSGPLARTAVSGLAGNRITPQGVGYSLANAYLNNAIRGLANPTAPTYK